MGKELEFVGVIDEELLEMGVVIIIFFWYVFKFWVCFYILFIFCEVIGVFEGNFIIFNYILLLFIIVIFFFRLVLRGNMCF